MPLDTGEQQQQKTSLFGNLTELRKGENIFKGVSFFICCLDCVSVLDGNVYSIHWCIIIGFYKSCNCTEIRMNGYINLTWLVHPKMIF